MSDLVKFKRLANMAKILGIVDDMSVDHVSNTRTLIKQIENLMDDVMCGETETAGELTDQDIDNLQTQVDEIVQNTNNIQVDQNITTSQAIEMFQLGASIDDVEFEFDSSSVIPPERGIIKQKLWKIQFTDTTQGYAIVSDTSDVDLSTLLNGQVAVALSTSPANSVEDLGITISMSDLENIIVANGSKDLTVLFNQFQKPGLTARQLRDIDVNTDPELSSLSTVEKNNLSIAIDVLNAATTIEDIENAQEALQSVATNVGLFSTSLGPTGNSNYSDLKRFNLQKDNQSIVSVTLSMPVISWGSNTDISGIPLRDENGPKNKTNRKDDGTCYIVDLGGIDAVIRNGTPNPLPATKFYNNGPAGATETEGALERYKGGKCLGINTTLIEETNLESLLKEANGVVALTIPPMTALWKIDRATFDLGNKHAYYTVFSASRTPPAGFMGVVFAPKQNRLGRGKGEIASGVTLANGISKTAKTFNLQDNNGAILDQDDHEVPSNLTGLTCDFDGHGMHPIDLLQFLETNSFIKGTQYLTIPANATIETVQDILIPAGQFIPQITQGVATLRQFGNGNFVADGGPGRFQPGLIPFLPGTQAYTPEWHINFIYYNCGSVECEGNTYDIENVASNDDYSSWIRTNHNASFGPPGPNSNNTEESKFSPAFPNTFDPVQLRCNIKNAKCKDFINEIIGSKRGEISLSMLTNLQNDNNIFLTEAPGGALRGWVKFLVVNCPLPIVVTVTVESVEQTTSLPPDTNNLTCNTCTCDRTASTVSINGILEPVWTDEDDPIENRRVKFKVGDNVIINATTTTMHGISLRFDDIVSNQTFDNNKTLETIQNQVLNEIKQKITINNEQDLVNDFIALNNDIITFHKGIPITFAQKNVANPIATPDGVVIADFQVEPEAADSSGSISCTVHGISMSFKFDICPL